MNQLCIKNMSQIKKKKKKGFTLVELIIVIAIIAILATIAIPKFGSIRTSANEKADIATAKNIQTIVVAGIADNQIVDTVAKQAVTSDIVTGGTTTNGTTTGGTTFSIEDKIDGGAANLISKVNSSAFLVQVTEGGNVVVYRDETGDTDTILAGSED